MLGGRQVPGVPDCERYLAHAAERVAGSAKIALM